MKIPFYVVKTGKVALRLLDAQKFSQNGRNAVARERIEGETLVTKQPGKEDWILGYFSEQLVEVVRAWITKLARQHVPRPGRSRRSSSRPSPTLRAGEIEPQSVCRPRTSSRTWTKTKHFIGYLALEIGQSDSKRVSCPAFETLSPKLWSHSQVT